MIKHCGGPAVVRRWSGGGASVVQCADGCRWCTDGGPVVGAGGGPVGAGYVQIDKEMSSEIAPLYEAKCKNHNVNLWNRERPRLSLLRLLHPAASRKANQILIEAHCEAARERRVGRGRHRWTPTTRAEGEWATETDAAIAGTTGHHHEQGCDRRVPVGDVWFRFRGIFGLPPPATTVLPPRTTAIDRRHRLTVGSPSPVSVRGHKPELPVASTHRDIEKKQEGLGDFWSKARTRANNKGKEQRREV
ncbi:hypothetical protein LXL04_027325 [Taraxacum kok-saghyz]